MREHMNQGDLNAPVRPPVHKPTFSHRLVPPDQPGDLQEVHILRDGRVDLKWWTTREGADLTQEIERLKTRMAQQFEGFKRQAENAHHDLRAPKPKRQPPTSPYGA